MVQTELRATSAASTDTKEPCPPCQVACPVHTRIRDYVYAIARGDYEEAYTLAREPNPLVYVCGRVCDHPCEDACRRGNADEPVAIAALKRFATERHDLSLGHGPPMPEVGPKAQKVAIIGAGPAGLSAAHDLARMGYPVTLFEAHSEPGGMLRLGLPKYRLPREIIDVDVKPILDLGIELKTDTRIGQDITLSDLKNQYEAIFIATGAQQSRSLKIEGMDLDGVLLGVDFLRDINLGRPIKLGKKILVIGGGNVAVDVARSAVRQAPLGAKEVHMICLESREEMPAHEWEIEEARREGIILHPSLGPNSILGKDGRVTGLETIVCTSVFDSEGRFRPTFAPHTEAVIEGDTVILAIGQASDLSFITPEDGIGITRRGTIAVDPDTLATSAPGIFAGGDVTTGAASVVRAVALGQRAAICVDAYLRGEDLSALKFEEPTELGELSETTIQNIKRLERGKIPLLPLEDRSNNYLEVELGYSEEMAVRAAQRCLTCGAGASADADKCTACLTCVRVCPYEVPTIEDRIAEIDITQCQACGICASECPAKAISLKLYREEEIIAQIERLLTAAPLSNPELTLLGFCCHYCAYADGESAGVVRAQLSPNVKVVELLCTGKLDVAYLLRAFELGADGVFVVGCPEEDCHNKTGGFRARKRVEYVKGLLDEVGLDGERLEMYNVPSDSWGKVTKIATEMTERVRRLGPNPLRQQMEV